MKKLSICIPTFNRIHCLEKCLESIRLSSTNSDLDFEVNISDNNPEANAKVLADKYKKYFQINYIANSKNIGLGNNILKASSMASGEFSWIIGNDDLMLPKTFSNLKRMFNNYPEINYFYINSFHLNSKYLFENKYKFDLNNINIEMKKFSTFNQTKVMNFFELINPKMSFDFLLGMFLSIYKTEVWKNNLNIINKENIIDTNLYSNFDNTCPHVKIFGYSFNKSKCLFYADPLSINLYGEREWNDLYPFIESIRIPQVLDYYRKNGMGLSRYLYSKNFALRKLLINLLKITLLKKYRGYDFISIKKDILYNLIYPFVWIGPFFYLLRFFVLATYLSCNHAIWL